MRAIESKALGRAHPLVAVLWFCGMCCTCVLVQHPLFAGALCAWACALYLDLAGTAGARLVAGLAAVDAAVAVANPLFNTQGATPLFSWPGGRPYTAEALALGASTALMFFTLVLLCASLSRVASFERVTGLFGGRAAGLALVTGMVLRLVFAYRRRGARIVRARRGIGRMRAAAGLRVRMRDATAALSALVSWALDSSVTTAASMRCRGYGCGRRTSIDRRPFTRLDMVALLVLAASASMAVFCLAGGCASASFVPRVQFAPFTMRSALLFGALSAFAGLPVLVDAFEGARWRFLLSRI